MSIAKHVLLNTGARMPTIGLGTFLAQGADLQTAVDNALRIGYRHIDTAYRYGNEAEIGDVLQQAFKEGRVKREDVFITTKVPSVYLDEKDVAPCAEESLDRLKLSYVDMLLVHAPWGLRNHGDGNLIPLNKTGERDMYHHDLQKTWRAMETVVEEGRTKAIGVSNFYTQTLDYIMETAKIPPANLQCECHVYFQQSKLRDYCAERNIVVTGYAPLGAKGRPDDRLDPSQPEVMDDPVIQEISLRSSRPVSQILLRYLLQIGVIPLAKSLNTQRLAENFNIYDFFLSRAHMNSIARLDSNMKLFTFDWAQNHPEFRPGEPF